VIVGADEPPVGDHRQVRRHAQVQGDAALGLVGRVVLCRPPQVGAVGLAGHAEPGLAAGGSFPGEAAIPRRVRSDTRLAAVLHGDPQPSVGSDRLGHFDPELAVAVTEHRRPQRALVESQGDRGHLQTVVQVELQPAQGAHGARLHRHGTVQPLRLGIDGEIEVVGENVVGRLIRRERAAGVGESGSPDRRGEGERQQEHVSHPSRLPRVGPAGLRGGAAFSLPAKPR
jgi:hypothetical protein